MKIAIIGFAALIIGVGGGAFVSGSKVKDQLLEEAALAHADSVSHAEEEHGGETAAGSSTTDTGGHDPDPTAQGTDSLDVDRAAHDAEVSDGSVVLSLGGTLGLDDATNTVAEEEAAPDATTTAAGTETSTIPPVIAAEREAPRFDIEGTQKLSKIFGAMKAPDAADVLEEMSDDEVKAILYQMSNRVAAAILGEFTPERAADLSRVVLRSGGGGS